MTKMAAMVIHGKTFTRNRMAIISLKPSIEIRFVFYLQLKCQGTSEGYPTDVDLYFNKEWGQRGSVRYRDCLAGLRNVNTNKQYEKQE